MENQTPRKAMVIVEEIVLKGALQISKFTWLVPLDAEEDATRNNLVLNFAMNTVFSCLFKFY